MDEELAVADRGYWIVVPGRRTMDTVLDGPYNKKNMKRRVEELKAFNVTNIAIIKGKKVS